MPARVALRVIERANAHQPGEREVSEENVLAAYQILADAMGATLEVTLDGQVVLYTGHFKADIQGVEDPKPPQEFAGRIIYAREPTPEDLTREELLAQRVQVFTVGETTEEAVDAYYAQKESK